MPLVSHMNFDQLCKCACVLFVTASKMLAGALTPIAFCPFQVNFFSSTLDVLQSVCMRARTLHNTFFYTPHFQIACQPTIFSKFAHLGAHLSRNSNSEYKLSSLDYTQIRIFAYKVVGDISKTHH